MQATLQATLCSTAMPAIDIVCEQVDQTSLSILRAVDETVEGLAAEEKALNGLMGLALSLIETVNNCERQQMIDPDDILVERGEKSEAALRDAVGQLELKRAAAFADPDLNGDNESAVVLGYDRTIAVAKGLHDALVDLRWAVMEHDSDLDVAGEATNDPEEAIARLRA